MCLLEDKDKEKFYECNADLTYIALLKSYKVKIIQSGK